MRSKPNTMTMILIALTLAASGDALATHEGTWHGGNSPAGYGFCEMLGDLAGAEAQVSCLALFE